MQALLLSLDEQHGGIVAAEDAGGPSNDAGPSESGSNTAAAHLPRSDSQSSPGRGGGSGSAGEAVHDAGHLSAGTGRAAAGAAASAASANPSAGGTAAAQSGSSAPEAADVPDAELLAHAARLAERATAHQLASSSLHSDPQAADEHSSTASAEASAGPATAAGSDATVAYVHTAPPVGSSAGIAPCQADGILKPHGHRGCGSSALAAALADAPGWAATDPGAPSSRPASSDSSSQACATAGIGSAALAQALAAANGWGTASAAQVATAQQPPFLGMVKVQAAAHIQRSTNMASTHPACCHQGAQAARAESPSSSQARAAGSDDAADTSDATEARSTGALPEAGGAALLLQPDGSSLLVLLTNCAAAAAIAAAAASAAEAAPPPEAGQRGVAAAGLYGPGVPLYEINCEVHSQRRCDTLRDCISHVMPMHSTRTRLAAGVM